MRTIPKEDRSMILNKADLTIIKQDTLHWKEVKYDGKRLIVCYNPERAELDAKYREDLIERIRDKIKSGDIKTLISNQDYKKFLKIEVSSTNSNVSGIVRVVVKSGAS